jgi:hypothetical protein
MIRRNLTLVLFVVACNGDGFDELDNGPEMFSYNAVWVFSSNDVWIGGSPTLQQPVGMAHFDGKGWTPSETINGAVSGIWAFAPEDIWAVGGENVYHYDGNGWTTTSLRTQGARELSDIWGTSSTDLWVVGDRFFHWDGTAWNPAGPGGASSLWGADKDHIWAMGTFDYFKYDGKSWSTFDLEIHSDEGDIWGFGSDDVWLAPDSERLAHWNGATWDIIENDDLIGDLATIWGSAPDDIWAAGSAGQIAHWDGSAWHSVRHQTIGAPYLQRFHAIHGSSSGGIWAVGQVLGAEGNHGIIFKRQAQ